MPATGLTFKPQNLIKFYLPRSDNQGMISTSHSCRLLAAVVLAAIVAGCADHPTILPNQDKNLRRTNAQFAADAAKRHPYKADAPRGGTLPARSQVDYTFKFVDLANLSDTDWDNIEVWVNKNYVVFVPKLEKGKLDRLAFQMLFDDAGNSFPTSKTRVQSVEVYKDGKMYDVTTKLAD